MTDTTPAVHDNRTAHRFEVRVGDDIAFVTYSLHGDDVMVIEHTEVPPALEGQGLGGRLAKAALDAAAQQGRRVAIKCPFVKGWAARHPEYASVVDG